MARSLNKKYFGNRNVGSASTTADDGEGGGYVASVTLGTLSTYTTRPTVAFSAPDKTALGAVTATGTVTSEALSAAVTTAGTGYVVGDLLTLTSAGGSAIAYVATVSTGAIATVNFTGTGASRGSFEALPGNKFPSTLTGGRLCAGGTGTGAELTVTFRAKAVVVTEQGSGYTDAADAVPTFTQSVTGTTVLGTDTGAPGSATNQENAITMTAFLTGGSALTVDIIRQVSGRRYKVTDGTLTGIVALTSTLADAAGEGSIAATDSAGGEYFVTKLTNRKATLTRAGGSGWLYATGEAAPWSFAAPATIYVQIANA
jgi:hypothetical protein